uniref:(northern house mosquito) hypothetical protein n=1 Tax=Culex pipiens TaxID=7175 RepID=A0A8D8BN19_CULPI
MVPRSADRLRRVPVSVHQPRSLRCPHGGRRHRQRTQHPADRGNLAGLCPGWGADCGPVGHDGQPDLGDQEDFAGEQAGESGFGAVVLGQVCVRVLRPVPGCGQIGTGLWGSEVLPAAAGIEGDCTTSCET